MIKTELVHPLINHASKSFTSIHDPSKITIQRIFCQYWDALLEDPEVKRRGLRPVVVDEVEKMMTCGTLDAGFKVYECPKCNKNHIIA